MRVLLTGVRWGDETRLRSCGRASGGRGPETDPVKGRAWRVRRVFIFLLRLLRPCTLVAERVDVCGRWVAGDR